jgi:thiol-disulfide isomerase/thioredoxin
VINFWASWCGPCVSEATDLEQTYQATKADGVTFLGVNTRGDERDAAQAFVANHKPSYPNVFDPAGTIALAFGGVATTVPATVVLDRQGRVAAVALGPVLRSTLQPVVTRLATEVS